MPDDISGITACFSPGVAHNADFEKDLTLRGVKCYLSDYSVESAPLNGDLFEFSKKFLGDINDDVFVRLEDWVYEKADTHEGDLILQMDIEGAEYLVFFDTPANILRRFRIIVVEFHDLHEIFFRDRLASIRHVFRKLLREFAIVHLHPNNNCPVFIKEEFVVPSVMEFTFLRRDRVLPSDRLLSFPHPLDAPNVDGKPDVVLPRCWY